MPPECKNEKRVFDRCFKTCWFNHTLPQCWVGWRCDGWLVQYRACDRIGYKRRRHPGGTQSKRATDVANRLHDSNANRIEGTTCQDVCVFRCVPRALKRYQRDSEPGCKNTWHGCGNPPQNGSACGVTSGSEGPRQQTSRARWAEVKAQAARFRRVVGMLPHDKFWVWWVIELETPPCGHGDSQWKRRYV